jgi:hypothetical protein
MVHAASQRQKVQQAEQLQNAGSCARSWHSGMGSMQAGRWLPGRAAPTLMVERSFSVDTLPDLSA